MINQHYAESDCGNYRISIGTKCIAWKKVGNWDIEKSIMGEAFETKEQAAEFCREWERR